MTITKKYQIKMTKPLILLTTILLFFNCTISKKVSNVENKGISIKLIEPQGIKIPPTLYLDIAFEVTNNTSNDIYMPKPLMTKDYESTEWPTFYNLQLNPADECMGMDLMISEQKRNLESFVKIAKNDTHKFSFNPHLMLAGLSCGYTTNDKIEFQLKYLPNPSYFKADFLKSGYEAVTDKEQLANIYAKIPRDTIKSQMIELIIN